MDSSIENYNMQDVLCLIENMYFEARSDGYAGMYATTMVVMNRVDDHRYPNTVCDVVRQGPVRESWKTRQDPDLIEADRIYYPIKNKCQFSWYCDGKADEMKDEDSFYLARDIARLVLDMSSGVLGEQQMIDITEGSTHYHTTYVSPNWRNDRGMMKITLVGSHIFYRWN
jgi:spore germination cell wall hydrolase CwlJ-like protein